MSIFQVDQWAILNESGQLFCDYDSLDVVEDSGRSIVPTEPQEEGKLYAYDKILEPSSVSVTLMFGGDYARQNAAMSVIKEAISSTSRFTIVTPEQVYENMTITGYSKTRSSTAGMNLLSIVVDFLEIRSANIERKTVQYSPRNPTSSTVVDEGRKQPSVLASLFGLED